MRIADIVRIAPTRRWWDFADRSAGLLFHSWARIASSERAAEKTLARARASLALIERSRNKVAALAETDSMS
jgi:hypothetical protein